MNKLRSVFLGKPGDRLLLVIISVTLLLCIIPLISRRSARSPFGEWSKRGCYVFSSNEGHTECHCDHMTNYAVLMRTTEQV